MTDEALISDIAHLMTGLCGSTCCHRTGGRGGQQSHPECDCRSAAVQVIARTRAETAKNSGEAVGSAKDPFETFRTGFCVTQSGGGEKPQIIIEYRSVADLHKAFDELSATLATPANSRAEAIGVKPLEWDEIHQQRSDEDPTTELVGFEADSGFFGYYVIAVQAASFELTDLNYNDTVHETEESAKAAAQADYEQRIRSALLQQEGRQ